MTRGYRRVYEVWCGRSGTKPRLVEAFATSETASVVRQNTAEQLNEFCSPENQWLVWVENKKGTRP